MTRFSTIIDSNTDKWTSTTIKQIYNTLKTKEHIPDRHTFFRVFQYFLIRQPNLIPYTLQQRFAIEMNPEKKSLTISNILSTEFSQNSWSFLGCKLASKKLKDIYGIHHKYTKEHFQQHIKDEPLPNIPNWLRDISPDSDGVIYGKSKTHMQNLINSKTTKESILYEWNIQNQMYQLLHDHHPINKSLKELFFQFSPAIEDLHRFPIFEQIHMKM